MRCIVRLKGGLGNQLFQYAAARALCMKHSASLELDLSLLALHGPTITPRTYALDGYPLSASVLSAAESARHGLTANRMRNWLAVRSIGVRGFRYVREVGFGFQPELLEPSGDVILDGFWQTPRYFDDVRPALLRELRYPQRSGLDELQAQMRSTSSVSIHVRRGDYVSNPTAALKHGACTLDYYREACRFLAARVQDPHYFIFSDDPAWAAENIPALVERSTLISGTRPLNAQEELQLMSECRHHVLANSSYSWWGAWLSSDTDSVVVAPSRWMADGTDTHDLIPGSWHAL